jgi:hypothetical protein
MSPLPKDKILNCKIVMRYENSVGKIYPKYNLYIYNNDQFLLSAKKVFKSTSSTYYIFNNAHNTEKKANSYIGKVSSNFLSTVFNIYDNGKKPGKNMSDHELRINYGTILYVNCINIEIEYFRNKWTKRDESIPTRYEG